MESAGVPGAEFGQAGVFLYGLLRDTDIPLAAIDKLDYCTGCRRDTVNKPHPTRLFFGRLLDLIYLECNIYNPHSWRVFSRVVYSKFYPNEFLQDELEGKDFRLQHTRRPSILHDIFPLLSYNIWYPARYPYIITVTMSLLWISRHRNSM